jgi:transcriptional regulator with XRE-family HTH domain
MTVPLTDRVTLREAVAMELRSELARNRISASRVAFAIGKDQPWISRRLTGQVAFDLDDLDAITQVMGISPSELMASAHETAKKPRVRIPDRTVDLECAWRDSNPQPSDP